MLRHLGNSFVLPFQRELEWRDKPAQSCGRYVLAETSQGPSFVAPGTKTNQTSTRSSAQRVADAHARFMDACLRGQLWIASNTAAVTFGTALTSTAVTATLSNPLGSGVNAVLYKTVITVAASSTAGSLVYAFNGFGALTTGVIHGTPGAIQNALLGTPNPAGSAGGPGAGCKCFFDTACTLPATPTLLRGIAFGPVTATATTGAIVDLVDGEIILQPGTALTVQGITIVGTGLISYTWEEVPV